MDESGHDQLGTSLLEAHRSVARSTARLFDLISEFEDSDAHRTTHPDVAAWLAWNLGVSRRTARRWARMSAALRELPVLRAALESAVISVDQLEIVLRVTTPDIEGDLLELIRENPNTDDLRREVRDLQHDAEHAQADARGQPEAYLNTWWRHDVLHLRGAIPGADGVAVERALHRLAAQAPRDPATGLYRDSAGRDLEALVQMASESLADDRDHDRATIVVNVPAADILARAGGLGGRAAHLLGGRSLAAGVRCPHPALAA